MITSVPVNPGGQPNAEQIAVFEQGGVNYPVYMMVDEAGQKVAYVDPFSGAVGTIEQEHLKIHEGKGFTYAKRLDIANGAGTHTFLLKVPALSFPHLRNLIATSEGGPFDVDIYEGPTVTADGTQRTPLNNNRNSSNPPSMEIFETPTIIVDGLIMDPILAPGNKQSGSSGSDGANEWDLKQNENYLVRIINNTPGGGNSRFVFNTYWYE